MLNRWSSLFFLLIINLNLVLGSNNQLNKWILHAPSKRKGLMDFSSISDESCTSTINDIDTEIQAYFDQPRISMDTLKFGCNVNKTTTQLSYLALQLLSVPCSLAPVERLFSHGEIVLSQRRSRISNAKLEKLLFIK